MVYYVALWNVFMREILLAKILLVTFVMQCFLIQFVTVVWKSIAFFHVQFIINLWLHWVKGLPSVLGTKLDMIWFFENVSLWKYSVLLQIWSSFFHHKQSYYTLCHRSWALHQYPCQSKYNILKNIITLKLILKCTTFWFENMQYYIHFFYDLLIESEK